MLNLQPDEQVLDVGCGIGGGDFFMATTYGCYVYGIDLSVNAVLSALERAAARGNELKVRNHRGFDNWTWPLVHGSFGRKGNLSQAGTGDVRRLLCFALASITVAMAVQSVGERQP